MANKFKVGDRVRATRRVEGQFTLGREYTVRYVAEHSLGVMADDKGCPNGWGMDYFELVQPAAPSAIRTVTRREIVRGVYGAVRLTGEMADDGSTCVCIDNEFMTPDELREAAHLFNQLAEVLEENAALEMKEAA